MLYKVLSIKYYEDSNAIMRNEVLVVANFSTSYTRHHYQVYHAIEMFLDIPGSAIRKEIKARIRSYLLDKVWGKSIRVTKRLKHISSLNKTHKHE